MVRFCRNCGYENKDEYDFCAKCGTQLVDNVNPPEIDLELEESAKKKVIAISYITTILLSWTGVIFCLLKFKYYFGYMGFFGIFMPFYLIQAPDKDIRKHGYIMFLISIVGIALSFYLYFY